MTPSTHLVGEDDLNGYVDGQLDPAMRAIVEQYLEAHPDVARRVAIDTAHRSALRAAFAGYLTQPVPPELNLNRLIEERLQRRPAWWRIAAAVVLSLGVGGAGGWLLRAPTAPDRVASAMTVLRQQALASHKVYGADRRHPIEVAASEREHLTQWLSNRLHRSITLPELSGEGYTLIGGRLLATEQGNAAALFMYQDERGNRVSLLMRPMSADLRVPIVDWDRNGVNACSWIDKGMGYALLGAVPDEELDQIARRISGQQG